MSIRNSSTTTSPDAADSRDALARRPRTPGTPLDEVSRQLVEALQEDGRRSYAALAQDVGLSEAAVRQRVKRLLDDGPGLCQSSDESEPELAFNRM